MTPGTPPSEPSWEEAFAASDVRTDFLTNWVIGSNFDCETAGRMPQIVGWGAGISIVMSALQFTGGSIKGKGKNERPDVIDEYERKEYLRRNRRRPMIETIAEVGEGRGKTMI